MKENLLEHHSSPDKPPYIIIRPALLYAFISNLKHLIFFGVIIFVSSLFEIPYLDFLALVPLIMGLYNIFYLRMMKYEVSESQIKFSRGIFSYNSDYLELYRIKDYSVSQPFVLRLLNLMHIKLTTSDSSHPFFSFEGIPKSNLPDVIRNLVELSRKRNRVYEVD